MKIILNDNYVSKEARIEYVEAEIEQVEAKLLTPSRTVDDIIRHMQLIKERNTYLSGISE